MDIVDWLLRAFEIAGGVMIGLSIGVLICLLWPKRKED